MLPRLSTTRTPSAVDSSVARRSESDFRWSTSAGPRLLLFFISLPFSFFYRRVWNCIRIWCPGQYFWKRSVTIGPTLRSIRTPRTDPERKHEAAQHRTRSARSRIGDPIFPRHLGPSGDRRAKRDSLSSGHGRRAVRGLGRAGERARRGRNHFLRLEARARWNPQARCGGGSAAWPFARLRRARQRNRISRPG